MRAGTRWELVIALAAVSACANTFAGPPDVRFEAPDAGLSATQQAVYWITGQAWGDVDGDDCPEAYVTDSAGANSLFANQCDGSFVLSPWNEVVSLPGAVSGGAGFVDYDGDGWTDLYVLNQGSNNLFRNLSGTGFQDVTTASGLGDPGEGETAAWADFDLDGQLDVYVVNWYWSPQPDSPLARDGLYRNNGDGTFSDVTSLVFGDSDVLRRPGFSASFLDFDNDGDLDLYVVNDKLTGNVLWRNDGRGCGLWCFTDISVSSGTERPAESMGLAVGDYDGDLDLDLYYTGGAEMILLQNQTSQGTAQFIETTFSAGVGYAAQGWGTSFIDVDNDGWEDLYVAVQSSGARRSNRLFRNRGDGWFVDLSDDSGANDGRESLGLATADYDRDGQVDLLVGNWGEGYVLYRNQTDSGNNWLRVRLIGGGDIPREPLGARMILTLDDGRQLLRELKNGSSLGAGNEVVLHFGLGTSAVVSAWIRWPNGVQQRLGPVPATGPWTVEYNGIYASGFEQ